MHALREDQLLALLRGVGLDDADAAERFVQAPGHLGVDLAALAEQRTQALERGGHREAEGAEGDDVDDGQDPVQVEEVGERQDGGDHTADQRHEAVADQVPDPLGVGHDPRDEDAGLGGVEVADGQTRDVRLDAAAHVGNRLLRRHPEDLRQGERGDGLHQRRAAGEQRQRHEQVGALLPDDVVNQILGGRRQHQSRQPVHQHQRQAEGEPAAPRDDERAGFLPGVRVVDFLLGGIVRLGGRGRAAGPLAAATAAHTAATAAASHGDHLSLDAVG